MKGELRIARHVIVEDHGDAPPRVLYDSLASTPDAAWWRCWQAGYRTRFETPIAMRTELEHARGLRCVDATLIVSLP